MGHLHRAKRLIEGFNQLGMEVDVIYGGMPVEIEFAARSVFHLPPVRAKDASYKSYLDGEGNPLGSQWLEQRKDLLIDHVRDRHFDMLLLEAYPFGRRVVRDEIQALIAEAERRNPRPLIVSSVRDILQEKRKPGRNEETRDLVLKHFDHVLVHADSSIIDLADTFPLAHEIREKLAYTGFVVPQSADSEPIESFDILCTAGGGGFGFKLLQTAIETACLSPWDTKKWCLATGPHMTPEESNHLRDKVPPNVTLVELLPNLVGHMKKAELSISQCGYNTAMDVLAAHGSSQCRAVFVPYDIEGQTEQLRRAQLLSNKGFAINVPQSELTPETLSKALTDAAKLERVEHQSQFDGIAKSARIVRNWLLH